MADCVKPRTVKPEFQLADSGIVESPEPDAEIAVELPQYVGQSISETPVTGAVAGVAYESCDVEAESAAELPKAASAAPDQAVIVHAQEAPEAVEVSPQAPLHLPSLDELHVKEGQRPRTTMAVASSLLVLHLSLKVGDKLKAKHQAATSPLTTSSTPHVPQSGQRVQHVQWEWQREFLPPSRSSLVTTLLHAR
ncbi:TPA: hypothetical protein ACH3X1_005240 [Trebouxia sp. C0004]